MNIENMKRVREAIARSIEPEYEGVGFDMEHWGWHQYDVSTVHELCSLPRDCETVACIAGFTVLELQGCDENPPEGPRAIELAAQNLLDLSSGEATHLFVGDWFPGGLENITPQDAITYLDRCIKAGRIIR